MNASRRLVTALFLALPVLCAVLAAGQSAPAPETAPDPFKALSFLEQNWEANTNGYGGI